MGFEELIVLIPSHSLEDFPSELGEQDAAGLLNAFAVLWHPSLLSAAQSLPAWRRADEPPHDARPRLVIVPNCSASWLPCGWAERPRGDGTVVLSGLWKREELLQHALAHLEQGDLPAAHLAADFLALGTCHLLLELLTRHMHHFTSLDDVYLRREVLAAAAAALAQDEPAARSRLATCFEILREARERFYPVDSYLLDLCLLTPREVDGHADAALRSGHPVNFLATAQDWEAIAASNPPLAETLKQQWHAGRIDLLGGEYRERPVPLLPLESMLGEFRRGREAFRRLFGRLPTTWARRRYGFSTLLPQILTRFGYHSALHIALDDGLYPDAEHSKIRWEGCDNSVVSAASRIPLAADSATSFLRFPQRLAETMEQDQVAALILARWPELTTPWFGDLCRICSYAPVLGRFISFDEFFRNTDDPGRLSGYDEREYLSPFLLQAVARQETDPISRFAAHFERREQWDAAAWCLAMSRVLVGQPIDSQRLAEMEQSVEAAGPDPAPEAAARVATQLPEFLAESAGELAGVVLAGGGNQPGYLLLNPLNFDRRVTLDLPAGAVLPPLMGPVKAAQFDESHRWITVDLPGSGYVWVPAANAAPPLAKSPQVTMVEERILRNEFFEVHINETTGGIAKIKQHGRKPNRLSQQLAFRFPRERTVVLDEGPPAEKLKTAYSEMRCTSLAITAAGPAVAEATTTGEILDQQNGRRLAGFRNVVRLFRGRPVVELSVELDIDHLPDGDPWSNYYAARFAWNDSTAALTRSVLGGAHTFQGERFESPHYFEIAEGEERTTIIPHGLPFHRKTGPRMLDVLLVVAGESRRNFRFTIALDQSYPLAAARDAMMPPVVVRTEAGPPRSGQSGWFFHLEQKNVQITRLMPLADPSAFQAEPWEVHDFTPPPAGEGFALRLVETEGRHRRVKLRCFREPRHARQCDFQGFALRELAHEGDAVFVEMSAYEIADVELRF